MHVQLWLPSRERNLLSIPKWASNDTCMGFIDVTFQSESVNALSFISGEIRLYHSTDINQPACALLPVSLTDQIKCILDIEQM